MIEARKAGPDVSFQSLLWFGVAGGSLIAALLLLHGRYVAKNPKQVNAGFGTVLFAICLLLFAIGAAFAGYASLTTVAVT